MFEIIGDEELAEIVAHLFILLEAFVHQFFADSLQLLPDLNLEEFALVVEAVEVSLNLAHQAVRIILHLIPLLNRNKRVLELLVEQRHVRLIGLYVERLVDLAHANLEVLKVLIKLVDLLAELLKLRQEDVLELVDVVKVGEFVNLLLHFQQLLISYSLRLQFVDVVLHVFLELLELAFGLLDLGLELFFDFE